MFITTYNTYFLKKNEVKNLGLLYILAVSSFIILFLINIAWVTSNLYYSTVDGFTSILRGEGSVENIYYSLYLKWILLADTVWLVIAMLFMAKRRNYKNERDIHFLKYKKFTNPTICMVIPAYNESESIETIVKEFLKTRFVTKVLVIDNHSTDKTAEIAEKAGATVIRKNANTGFGHSVALGLKESLKANTNIIGITEADGTSNSYDVEKMLPYLDNCDMVIGTRQDQVLTQKGNQNKLLHVWGNFLLAKLIQIKYFSLLHTGIVNLTDVGCLFRLISRDALEEVVDDLFYLNTDKPKAGIAVHLHLTMLGIEKDLRIIEIPITFNKRIGKSKLGTVNTKNAIVMGLKFLWFIIKN